MPRGIRSRLSPGAERLSVLVQPAVPILLLAGTVHIVRRNAFDIATFFAMAAVIVLDSLRTPRPGPGLAERRPAGPWLGAGAVVVGCLCAPLPVGSWPLMVGLAAIGVAALAAVLRTPPSVPAAATPTPRGWVMWAGLAIAVCLWELWSFVHQPDPDTDSHQHPTISALVDPLMSSPLVRGLLLAVWVAGGAWLVRTAVRAGRRSRT